VDQVQSLFGDAFAAVDDDLDLDNQVRHGQYMTPRWASTILFERFFGDADASDSVLEPSCGDGAWLEAIPTHVPAIGVEIDPALAERAHERTGRHIIIGDFTQVALDCEPSIVVGNLPFKASTIAAFMDRLREIMLPSARAGLILPAYALSFAQKTIDVLRGFDVQIELLPRDIYPRTRLPLLFARMTKHAGPTRLIGFALYEEAVAIRSVRAKYRTIMQSGRRPMYRELLETALQALGGQASLGQICRVIENHRPSESRFWRDAMRRTAGEICERIEPGLFRLRTAA
jgi:adenine-specific DNA-methyltransferase